jgi:hypothetical protein
VLAEPPLAEAGPLLARNRHRLGQAAGAVLGRAWDDLRRQARQAALAAAGDYFRQGGEPVPSAKVISFLMAGHQPELFHPGVWVKNFALQGLARRHGLTPINLVVDNDTPKVTGLRIPMPASPPDSDAFREHPVVRLALVPFDGRLAEEPYEERTVHDENLFTTFADRVDPILRGWGFRPLLYSFWEEVCRQARRTPLLGERLASARRTFERAWGCANLELPVSRLCRTEPFAWFACHLLANLHRFHEIYNASLNDYRRIHGLRSRHHPVPDLVAEGPWREVPFWAWHTGQKRRARLFARSTEGVIELRAGDELWPRLPLPAAGDPGPTVAAWLDLDKNGLKVRSRALTNTLYARLFLADLFLHGIGGGKYDEATDEIVRRFYGFEPPGFLVLSATLLLPLPAFPVQREDVRCLARQSRDLQYNPQRHLDGIASAAARELANHKQALITQAPADRASRRVRFRTLRRLTEELRPYLGELPQDIQRQLTGARQQLEANAVTQRRDFAFCLYPEELLRPFCQQFLS